jgi:hypothetical protein
LCRTAFTLAYVGLTHRLRCDGGEGGGSDLLLSGTVCGDPTSYRLKGDERIVVIRAADGMLEGLLVLDGEPFDTEDEAAWARYAAQHDTFLLLAFDDPDPRALRIVHAGGARDLSGEDAVTSGARQAAPV